ncbi:prolyl-tRNA synthetase associated domain-containing protein [Aliikangiella sp. G2MR2-5]|uniref:prolyl-tRNA synthetase associated domain-containing protein n=1 Tax=Aliikangiella sp. G2MR2-5 TaxID=2788943 RepID=UPI0018A9BA1D|nr:prolyl-tRNA synthetase associated domain-containing protein [Aliikangiella sp. G2MR2-5]
MQSNPVIKYLDDNQIAYSSFDHPPLHDSKEADRLAIHRPGTRLKNLFLRDNYGRRHFLLLVPPEKSVDLKQLSKQLKVSRLGFASAERLDRYLEVKPGSVSLLALLNDKDNCVELLIDNECWCGEAFQCHPLINTATLVLSKKSVQTFVGLTGHSITVIDVPLLNG